MSAERFLAAVAAPDRPLIDLRVAIVLAHPDDETLGCGALLARLSDVTIVHVTDGAPRGGDDAARQGFATPQGYAAARKGELEAALMLAGVPMDRLTCLGIADQEAALNLGLVARKLAPLIAGAAVVLTHAYEGGHPDHDAVAFAVDAAWRLLGPEQAPAVVEMPFYRAGPDGPGWIRQVFSEDGPEPVTLRLSDDERARKQAMLDAHWTQSETLASFGAGDERFRIAPVRDFARPANGGLSLYDGFGWAMNAARFGDEVRRARLELGFEGP